MEKKIIQKETRKLGWRRFTWTVDDDFDKLGLERVRGNGKRENL